MGARRRLAAITYLSPSIPTRFFRFITDYLGRRLEADTNLIIEPRISGPRLGDNPFETGEVDMGFMCAPSLVLLHEMDRPSLELLPAAPVFDDERGKGRPVYFSDVVVHTDTDIERFEDLRGRSWAYNDPRSLSGWHSALERLRALGSGSEFFSSTVAAGSHLESLRLVVERRVDAAAIDSTTLLLERARRPEQVNALRIVESWGPFPVQPVVVRSSLDRRTKDEITAHLMALGDSPEMRKMSDLAFTGFAPANYGDYLASKAIVGAARMLADDTHH
ncbi:MAG: phosphate/phosphite/phosphonate ABC transporter substrate-binding protein [Actinomycetota bacterium]